MKHLIVTIFVIFVGLMPGTSYASQNASGSSAKLVSEFDERIQDRREEVLRDFLLQYDSPLAPFAEDFVESADKDSLD